MLSLRGTPTPEEPAWLHSQPTSPLYSGSFPGLVQISHHPANLTSLREAPGMNLRAWLWRVQLRHCCWCSSFHVVSREFLSGDDFSEVPLDTSDCMLTPASTSCNYNQDEERLENLPALPGHAYSLFMEPNNAHNGALRPRSMLWWCPIQTLAVLPSGFALLAPPGNLQHRAFGCVPLGEQCCVSPRLIVNDFQGTPRGVILHKAVMLAYAFPDPWLSANSYF